MDFGGKKNVGTAVGIIDGMVYLGTGAQSLYYGMTLPNGDDAKNPANWHAWPTAMIPVALIGLVLAARLWNAKPAQKKAKSVTA
jgi:OPA family glycerol-3-phosphate transporter-like MFS transporter